jgi:hypothetical protein
MWDTGNLSGYTPGGTCNGSCGRTAGLVECTMNITVVVEVNMYSPQIGQSHSKLRSMHLCRFWSDKAMQTLHFLQWK